MHDAVTSDDYVWAQFIDNRIVPVGSQPELDAMLLLSALISGLGLGSMYGLMALGFYVTYAVSGTVNFAQGSSMMLGAVLTYAFAQTLGWPMAAGRSCWRWLLCALYGLLVELLAVRPFVQPRLRRLADGHGGAWASCSTTW